MAEFDALDELLSGSLKRAAQPGDSAGVADTIRARVAAGDTGTPAPSQGTAPGFGSGVGSWLPWVGLLVVGAIVGGALGVSGVAGRPVLEQTSANQGILIGLTVAARSCPDGPIVAELTPGSRVLAIARSEDGGSVQVRNPSDTRSEVWIPASKMESDSGQPAFASLPVGDACPVVSVPLPVAAPPIVTPVTPTKPGKPPVPDTTKPTVGKPTSNIDPVCNNASGYPPAIISVSASDNVGVTGVSISWSGAETGSGSMSGSWSFSYHPANPAKTGAITFTVRARDAAGNLSSTNSVTIQQLGCVG